MTNFEIRNQSHVSLASRARIVKKIGIPGGSVEKSGEK